MAGPPQASLKIKKPAAPTGRQPTPEETQHALEQGKLNHQTPHWTGEAFEYIPIAGDPANSPVSSATTAGNADLTADMARRQAAANPFQIAGTGQFDSGRQTITNDPAANLRAAAANPAMQASRSGFMTAPLTTAPRVVTQNPAAASRMNALAGSIDLKPSTTVVNPSKTEQGATQAAAALGPAPKVDMGLADRGQNTVQQALGLSQQAVNAALAPVDQTSLTQATADARSVLDALLNGPNTADRIGSQTLRSQLALARSAAGGPGAVQEALRNAQMAAPELEAQAAQAGTAETLQRTQAAGNVAGQLQTAATNQQANQTARINAASSAASGFAQGALGSRAQDIDISKANLSAASNLLDNVRQLTGQQLELDQRNQELIGQMARDANATNFNWGQLSAQQQEAEFDRWVKVYGIDQAAAAQIKAAAKASQKNAWDYIIPLVGAGATIAAGALAGPPGAIAAGAATGAATQAAS